MKNALHNFNRYIGISGNRTSHREKIISGVGGFTGIIVILIVTRNFVDAGSTGLIVASMGASAVLVFAVPHGPLSQPWPLAGGHLISAVIGVSCYLLFGDLFFAAAVAVGLAITAMYYLRCIHPPGGATALTAVIAGSGVHDLGYRYLFTPVLINVAVIFAVAVVFNYLFPWRRYPAAMMRHTGKVNKPAEVTEKRLDKTDLEHALQQMNLHIDISHADLEQIYLLAQNRTRAQLTRDQITLGHYYSNGKYGSHWSVRQVVDESHQPESSSDQLIYKTVAGKDRRSSGVISRDDFAQWAKHEVYLNESSWQRVKQIAEIPE